MNEPRSGSLSLPAFLPLLSVLLLPACGGEGAGAGWAGTVDTLANGAVEVSNPARGAWAEDERWRLTVDLRIGALESGGPDQFGSVRGLRVDGAGRIYVLESQAREVRVFDAGGAHVRTFGSRGGGPGELESPVSLEWGPDGNLWIGDFGNRRWEVFDTAGARVGSHPFHGLSFGGQWGPDGFLYQNASVQTDEGFESVLIRSRLEGEAEDPELRPLDTLPRPEVPEGEIVEADMSQGGNSFTMRFPVPLTARSQRFLVPGQGWWLTDPGPRYRLAMVDFRGDTVRVVGREYEPVPVTDEVREEAATDLPGEVEVRPDRIPDVHPPVRGLEPGPRGGLWVRRQTGPDREGFDVFDPEGRYLGELAGEVPVDRLSIRILRDEVAYGVLRDELDVPYVVRLRIERP